MSEPASIRIRGAREHNLKGINVDLPRNRFVVITGLSGSGKSTLAFDTIYAEGQRRYMESLSAYARQFLEQMEKPDVESIEGLTPTIAIEQRSGSSNPRSTVATTTEIYDYLRVLFARVGEPHCPACGRKIETQTAEQIVDAVLKLPEGARFSLLAPMVRGKKGEHREVLARARREGFVRLRIDGKTVDAREVNALAKNNKHEIAAVVDRLVMKPGLRSRLTESVEMALKVGEGIVLASIEKSGGEPEDRLFSELYACPEHGTSLSELSPRIFSFNSPYGACPDCDGLGTRMKVDPELLVADRGLSVEEGLLASVRKIGYVYGIWYGRQIRRFLEAAGASATTPFGKLPPDVQKALLRGCSRKQEEDWGFSWNGILNELEERFRATENQVLKERIHEYMASLPCPACGGARLKPESLAVRIAGKNIRDVTAFTIDEALAFFDGLGLKGERAKIAAPLLKEVRERLSFLRDVGLAYLTLDRTSHTLAGGEAQRIRLASQVGSKLVGVTYVLDEPTIGLHQRDNDRLLDTLIRLRDLGNTVLVVEHDEGVMRRADYLVDLGPGAGEAGGEVVGRGSVEDLVRSERSLTGKYLSGEACIDVPASRRRVVRSKALRIVGAKENNLKSVDVDVPLGVFVCVTGVSGSGKSSLVNEVLYKYVARHLMGARTKPGACTRVAGLDLIDKVICIDQSPIGRTPRSNPATYTGVFDEIRKLFARIPEAKIRGYNAGRFSFNVKGGRCESCQGQGVKAIEMHFLSDVYVTCDACKGRRFNRETLDVKYRDLSVADVLDLSVSQALELFKNHPRIRERLQTLQDVGLGYVRLGQSSTTLSGGEAQRVKLADELGKRATGNTLYVLDEPTTGLHFHDIAKLLEVLQRLVGMGNSVVVIEHNLDVIKQADWIVDLGPEGGEAGGRVVAVGTPEGVAECRDSVTGQYLERALTRGRTVAQA